MNINIQAKDLSVTKHLREFAFTQIMRKLSKFKDKILDINLYLEYIQRKSSDPKRAKVTINVNMPKKNVVIKKNGYDLYEVVVAATDTVYRKVREEKDKRTHTKRLADGVKTHTARIIQGL